MAASRRLGEHEIVAPFAGDSSPPSPDVHRGGGEPLVRAGPTATVAENKHLTDYVISVTVMELTLLK